MNRVIQVARVNFRIKYLYIYTDTTSVFLSVWGSLKLVPTMETIRGLFGLNAAKTSESEKKTKTKQLVETVEHEYRILTEELRQVDQDLEKNTKDYDELQKMVKANRETRNKLIELRAQKLEECERKKDELQFTQR